jgi:DNA-binding NtrC family response regulator
MTVALPDAAGRSAAHLDEALSDGPVIVVVENDWRTCRFIFTVLKYETHAAVIEAPSPSAALSMVRSLGRPVDLLIVDVDLASAGSGIEFAREVAGNDRSMNVLLISGKDHPPFGIPPAWKFLSIPFSTAALLDCVEELCCSAATPPYVAP